MNASRALLFVVSVLAWSPGSLYAADFEIDNYRLTNSVRISRTVFEYTYKADVSNWSGTDSNISATVTSTAAMTTVTQNALSFGDVPDGATIESSNTFVIRHDRTKPFDENALVWTVQATPLPPTTFELIDKAVTDGVIDAETALVYKVFDEFNDDRLPTQYRGRDPGFFEATALGEAQRQFDSLSPTTQGLLAPFFVRPTEPGSWIELQVAGQTAQNQVGIAPQRLLAAAIPAARIRWDSVVTANGKARIWWMPDLRPQDEARAQAFKAELDGYLWTRLTEHFGEPRPDDRVYDAKGNDRGANPVAHGPDDLFDIYLTRGLKRAVTKPADNDACDGSPYGSYTLLTPFTDNSELAHELMHAILSGYPLQSCHDPEYLWMHEATASWAENFAYKVSQREQRYAPTFLSRPGESLNFYEVLKDKPEYQYGAYLWFFRLVERGLGPDIVRETWEAAATHDSLSAIDVAIQGLGGFDQQWPAFVLDNWNRDARSGKPYRNYFEWDQIKTQAEEAVDAKLSLEGKGLESTEIPYFLPRLSATYLRGDFRTDPQIRSVLFTNTDAGTQPTTSIQAIVKVKGKGWQPAEDWSNDKEKFACFDKAEVEQLVLVIANRGFRDSDPEYVQNLGNVNLSYSARPCHDWTGSFTYRREFNQGSVGLVGETHTYATTATATGLRFHMDTTQDPGSWLVVEGVITWNTVHHTQFSDGSYCNTTASGTIAASDRGKGQLGAFFATDDTIEYLGNGWAFVPPHIEYGACSDGFTFVLTDAREIDPVAHDVLDWFYTGPTPWPFALGATGIQGSYSDSYSVAVLPECYVPLNPSGCPLSESWTWDFSKAPLPPATTTPPPPPFE